jgi:hypothetical protein
MLTFRACALTKGETVFGRSLHNPEGILGKLDAANNKSNFCRFRSYQYCPHKKQASVGAGIGKDRNKGHNRGEDWGLTVVEIATNPMRWSEGSFL